MIAFHHVEMLHFADSFVVKEEDPNPNTVRNLASGLLKLTDAAERAEFLDWNCGEDPSLREAVEKFVADVETETIATDGRADSRSSKPAPLPSPVIESVGSAIGPYQLTKVLGEGGFGIVYEAKQQEPVRRTVALKIIKPGMDTEEVIARFKAERQALALMDHPNIAKVFDAGTTDSGRPYFVMELVSGEAINNFCDRRTLSTRQRLDLFIPVCKAVQHAHQKAVIHRDLKPSNILVSEHDGVPVPTIIDFGIAKALHQELTGRTLFTAVGMVIGTPQYMSPEQAAADPSDIDTQSDIYSLGVVLYELLTGSTPIDVKSLRKAAYDQILILIREFECPKPSTRIRSLRETGESESVARHRHSDSTRLVRSVRGDLDWIVMKAIEKDRNRRYESVATFYRDIEHYLNNEPVSATPPSAGYRLRKFARRNRGWLSAAAAVVVALLIGTIVSITQAVRANRAREQAEAVAGFLVTAFRSPDPNRDGRTITVFEVLDREVSEIDDHFKDDPNLRSRLLQAIGQTYAGLGLDREAGDLQRKNLELLNQLYGADHVQSLAARQDLGNTLRKIGSYGEAIELLEGAVSDRRQRLGPDHPDTIRTLRDLASAYLFAGRHEDGIRLHEESREKLRALFGERHPETIRATSDLGAAWFVSGDYRKALAEYEMARQQSRSVFGPNHIRLAEATEKVATAFHQLGKISESVRMHRDSLRIIEEKYGPDHQTTLSARIGLALALSDTGDLGEAIGILEKTAATLEATLGEDHSNTLECRRNLGIVYHDAGRNDEAIGQLQIAWEGSKELLGPDHPDTLSSMNSFTIAVMNAGRHDEAVELFRELYELSKKARGEADPETLRILFNLSIVYFDELDRKDEAMELQEELLAIHRRAFGDGDPRTLVCQSQLARGYGVMGKHERTIELLEPIYESLARESRPDHAEIPQAAISLAKAFRASGRNDEAERLLLDAYEKVSALHRAYPGVARPVSPARAANEICRHYDLTGQQAKFEEWQEILREEREKAAAAAAPP